MRGQRLVFFLSRLDIDRERKGFFFFSSRVLCPSFSNESECYRRTTDMAAPIAKKRSGRERGETRVEGGGGREFFPTKFCDGERSKFHHQPSRVPFRSSQSLFQLPSFCYEKALRLFSFLSLLLSRRSLCLSSATQLLETRYENEQRAKEPSALISFSSALGPSNFSETNSPAPKLFPLPPVPLRPPAPLPVLF